MGNTTATSHLTIPDEYIDWRAKGIWWPGPPVPAKEFVAARHGLFSGVFTWPVMVARRTAIEHNIATLAAFCARHGLLFAPHGKTTMAPALFDAQLRAGAWAITVATANQVLAARAFGVPRVLLANELLDPAPLRWVAGQIARGFEFYCQVDSPAAVAAMAHALAPTLTDPTPGDPAPGDPTPGPVPVLVEFGYPGGRTGCRTTADLTEVARAVTAAPGLALAGVAGYEGGLPGVAEAGPFLDRAREATGALAAAGLLPESVLFAAGGSAYFDLVAERLAGSWLPGHTLRTVLRSGAYISHDHGIYVERTPFRRAPAEGSLVAALEVWAQVTSVPEPGLAIVGLGKREVSYDEGLPVPLKVRRRDGSVVGARGLRVDRLNDHHAFVAAEQEIHPGDLICLGISHPCTAFEKWQVIPVVEDDDTVSDLLYTYF